MTYATSGLIQASDYNGFINSNLENINSIWSTGSGDRGYGQTQISAVAVDEVILSATQLGIVGSVTSMASHQGTTIASWTNPTPVNGSPILYESNLSSNITATTTNRLNAVAQASSSTTTATTVSTWLNTLTYTFTVTFAGNNQARYFFNAGGQIAFNFSHPSGTTINTELNQLCLDTGTVYASSPTSGSATIVGTAYNGVTKVGGGYPAGQTINTNYGFYAFTPTLTQIFQQDSSSSTYYYGTDIYLRISAASNGSGILTFTVLVDNSTPLTISAGTVANLILRPPSTVYLTNTWGTPTVTSGIVTT